MTAYDESVLQQYAEQLYRRAKGIVFWTAVKYGVVVFLVSFLFVVVVGSQKRIDASTANDWLAIVVILTAVGTAAGVDEGRRKAFALKLEAQQALCQRQIELNTRTTKPLS